MDDKAEMLNRGVYWQGYKPQRYFKAAQIIYHSVNPAIDVWEKVKQARKVIPNES